MRTEYGQSRSAARRIRDLVTYFASSSPARFAIMIFTALSLALTLVLTLPIASATRSMTPLADALFTAVSAICVTGLTTVDMSTHWSSFGNIAILAGMQVGGIGVLTLASILGLVVSRRIGLRQKLLAASDSNPLRARSGPVAEGQAIRLGEIGNLLLTVAISVLVIEIAVSALIIPHLLLLGWEPWAAVWKGFYFAASAFTNTGFVPTVSGMDPFVGDIWMLAVLTIAVFLGSIGFPVIFALVMWVRHRRRFSVHVKLTLVTTVILLAAGAVMIAALEWSNRDTLGAQEPWFRPITAVFLSMMTRSGGFSTVDVPSMNGSTHLGMDMLMFVGGGSASTAGGIKVTTLAILFLAALAEARGDDTINVFSRRIPTDVLRVSVSIVLWGATIVAASSIAILHITREPLDYVLFDVISAFGTCGLSTGLPERSPDSVKYILAATMWAGRVGTVTLAAALASSQRRTLFKRPEERPIVG